MFPRSSKCFQVHPSVFDIQLSDRYSGNASERNKFRPLEFNNVLKFVVYRSLKRGFAHCLDKVEEIAQVINTMWAHRLCKVMERTINQTFKSVLSLLYVCLGGCGWTAKNNWWKLILSYHSSAGENLGGQA